MFDLIDSLIDRINMYRLVIYYLAVLLGAAVVMSTLGIMHYNPVTIAASTAYLLAVCWISNKVFAYVFNAPANPESTIITALILALIISPTMSPEGILFLTAAGGLAMASKYILAINKKQLFNPAAIAVVLTSYGAGQSASWWVGSAPLLPFVLVGGLLLVRKIHRIEMASIFIFTTYVTTAAYVFLSHGQVVSALTRLTLNSAIFFLASVMLTEPFTSPRNQQGQRWYAIVAGLLFPPQVHLGALYSTPELALVVSNAFAYIINPPVKATLTLIEKIQHTPDTYDFVLQPEKPFRYKPGQYIEVAAPHTHTDSRGNRRFFTLASSPTEKDLRLGIKFYENGSSYKHALLQASDTSAIVATQLGGDFTLPKNQAQKLAFIAGGIGITPFRSMMKYLTDTNEHRDVVLLYGANRAGDFVYQDVLEQARKQLGANTFYCISGETYPQPNAFMRNSAITADLIREVIPDYAERLFYLSGPHGMVEHMQHELRRLGVPRSQVKVDFFPGY